MDKKRHLEELVADYRRTHRRSQERFQAASRLQILGGSHNLRLFHPFPFYDEHSSGSLVRDIDGNTYVDFWQGHFGNILGHNPPVVLDALRAYFQEGQGLATGFPGVFQEKLARIICDRIGADKIRFTTSGTLATMYATMLSKAFTGREKVLKIGGGWHGAQPYALKGISTFKQGLNQIESAGLPLGMDESLILCEFNREDDLEEKFRAEGDRIACLILEPFIGAGGFLFAEKKYLRKAREITEEYGALLIFDEVISGFRFHAGALQSLYDVRPDLTVFGKAIGGGMPVSALAGRADVLELCGPQGHKDKRVKFEGGTFSAHPAAMLAGYTFLNHLIEHEDEIYPRIGRLGERVRKEIPVIFARYGIDVQCTGGNRSVAEHSSVVGVHFMRKPGVQLSSPEQVWNPDVNDFELRESLFKLAMLREGFNTFHGYGTISTAHSDDEIQASLDAVDKIARVWHDCSP